MMLALLALAWQASALTPPADWQNLPRLPLQTQREPLPQLTDFVREEVRAGRCSLPQEGTTLDLAVWVTAQGRVRRIVPRAIGCPTVEQYVAGIVLRSARDNLTAPGDDTWFRTSVALPRP